MKKKYLSVVISLIVCMLAACGSKESSQETTKSNNKVTVESTKPKDKEETKKETTSKEVSSSDETTKLADAETTKPSEETTKPIEETSKQEQTTAQQQVTTIQKSAITEKNTTTKQQQTTTKQEVTTTKKQEETTKQAETTTVPVEPDDGLKSTLVAAAKTTIESYDGNISIGIVAFNDVSLDGVPEFFIMDPDSFANVDGKMYKYVNGEYIYCMDITVFNHIKVYKDKNTGIGLVLMMDSIYNFDNTGTGEVVAYDNFYIVDTSNYTSTFLASAVGTDVFDVTKREYFRFGNGMTKAEFEKIFTDIDSKYTYVRTIGSNYDWGGDGLDSVDLNNAYNMYLNSK